MQSRNAGMLAALKVHLRVIAAILVRDMRTRFGRTHLSYLVAVGMPLSHIISIVVAFITVNRIIPFGSDSTVFISTGALPYILCLYPARMMAFMMIHTGSTLAFPIVHPVDLIISRMILEGLTAFSVALIFVLGLWACDVEVFPADLPSALLAVYAAVFFGLSIGTLGMILRAIFKTPGYVILVLTMIGLYLTSGVYVPLAATSETVRTLISYNPIYQLVQWLRSSYFEIHSTIPLDRSYVLLLSSFLFGLGLLGERLFRGKVLT